MSPVDAVSHKNLVAVTSLGGMPFGGTILNTQIQITYHRNRMWAAGENSVLLDWYLANERNTKPTLMLLVKSGLFRMTSYKESQAMQEHEEALIQLGYLEKREFWLTNHFTKWSNIQPPLIQKVTNTFDSSHWCSYYFPETNKLVVTATPADMPKWEKLISDFDTK